MPFILYRKREVSPIMPVREDTLNPKKGRCKYPFGDPREKTFRFCDEPREATASYCAEHAALCYLRKMTPTETKAAQAAAKAVMDRSVGNFRNIRKFSTF